MARISPVTIAAVGGGLFGSALVAVLFWAFGRNIPPAAVTENVQPTGNTTKRVIDPRQWANRADIRKTPSEDDPAGPTSPAITADLPAVSDQPQAEDSGIGKVAPGVDLTSKIPNEPLRLHPQAPEASPTQSGSIEDALSFALEAADPFIKEGFTVREDHWGGDLPVRQSKAIVHQLFKGNDYWFWMGTDTARANISVHVYDSQGNLAELDSWQTEHKAAARISPKSTGSYYLIVAIEKSPEERTHWSLVYGFR
jgi:hypothetical protein